MKNCELENLNVNLQSPAVYYKNTKFKYKIKIYKAVNWKIFRIRVKSISFIQKNSLNIISCGVYSIKASK